MNRQKLGLTLLGIGFLYVIIFASLAGLNLMHTLRTHSYEEVQNTIWAMNRPLFLLWAFSVPLGTLLGIIGAFVYTGIKKIYIGLTGFGFLCVVFAMTILFTRFYSPSLFGIGGSLILIFFFLIVWLWMRNYETLNNQEKIAAVFQLIGYLFFITASWFLCGEFGPLRLKAFEGRNPPSPIEIMVYLVLGWLFFFLSHYKSSKAPPKK